MAVTSNRLGCQSSVCTSQECNHRFTVILNLDICLAGVNRSVSMDTRAVNTVFRQTRINQSHIEVISHITQKGYFMI